MMTEMFNGNFDTMHMILCICYFIYISSRYTREERVQANS